MKIVKIIIKVSAGSENLVHARFVKVVVPGFFSLFPTKNDEYSAENDKDQNSKKNRLVG